MNEREMNEALDAQLAKLATDVSPRRDLWPEIAARLQESDETEAPVERRYARSAWWQLGAAAVLVAASSLTTWFVMNRQNSASEHMAAVALVQGEIGAEQFLPASYVKARMELSVAYDQ